MNVKTALQLGRISNLPTIWSNVLAASVISAGKLDVPVLFLLIIIMSLMYTGGMFLNDAFDADWDKTNKPLRPIPGGNVSRYETFFYGFIGVLTPPLLLFGTVLNGNSDKLAALSGLILATVIVLYDWLHRSISFAPWLMGLCRFLVYVTTGLAIGEVNITLIYAGISLFAYIVGITYMARAEHLNTINTWWPLLLILLTLLFSVSQSLSHPALLLFPLLFVLWVLINLRHLLPGYRRNIPMAIGNLLAGIPLFDATVLAGTGHWWLAIIAVCLFLLTRKMHQIVPGT